jgi:hypothetical protein
MVIVSGGCLASKVDRRIGEVERAPGRWHHADSNSYVRQRTVRHRRPVYPSTSAS